MLRSHKPEVREFARVLQEVQDQFTAGDINERAFRQKCSAIQEAAEVLAGFGDFDETIFQRAGLTGITPETPRLVDAEYVAIADDLGLQMHAERGVANRMPAQASIHRTSNQASTPPPQSNTTPARARTLADLPGAREQLHRSVNPAARRFGQLLQEIHDQFMDGRLNHDTHLARAHEILAAAAALAGEEADFDQEALQTIGLGGATLQDHRLTNAEYLAISDDLGVQRHPQNGVLAYRARVQQSRMDAQRHFGLNVTQPASQSDRVLAHYEIERGATAAQVIANYHLSRPQDIAEVQAHADQVASRGVSRALPFERDMARVAIEQGATAAQAIARFNLRHREDLAEARAHAHRLVRSGGPRISFSDMMVVRYVIDCGATAAQAIAHYRLRHPDDIAEVQAHAALVADSVRAGAMRINRRRARDANQHDETVRETTATFPRVAGNSASNPSSVTSAQANTPPARLRTLADLSANRERFGQSTNPSLQGFGQILQEVNDQLMDGRMNDETHLARAQAILAAAAMLAGNPEDYDPEVLHAVGLSELTSQPLTNADYLAISDDLGVQRHPERGVLAYRERVRQSRRDVRRRFNHNAPVVSHVNNTQAMAANNGERRASRADMRLARFAIEHGDTAVRVIAMFHLTDSRDIAEVQAHEAQVRATNSNWPRASASAMNAARFAIDGGGTVAYAARSQDVSDHSDIRELNAYYAQRMGRIMSQARSLIDRGVSIESVVFHFRLTDPSDIQALEAYCAERDNNRVSRIQAL